MGSPEASCMPDVDIDDRRFPNRLNTTGRKRASDVNDKNYMGRIVIGRKCFAVSAGLNVIGRDKGCDVLIKNYTISRNHAIVTIVDNNQHFISDFNSFNGTRLNNVALIPLKLYPLADNDKLMFGEVNALYKMDSTDETNTTQNSESLVSQNIYDAPTQDLITDGKDLENQEPKESIVNSPINEISNSDQDVIDEEFRNVPTEVLNESVCNEISNSKLNQDDTRIDFHDTPTEILTSPGLNEISNSEQKGTSTDLNETSNSDQKDTSIDYHNAPTQLITRPSFHEVPTQLLTSIDLNETSSSDQKDTSIDLHNTPTQLITRPSFHEAPTQLLTSIDLNETSSSDQKDTSIDLHNAPTQLLTRPSFHEAPTELLTSIDLNERSGSDQKDTSIDLHNAPTQLLTRPSFHEAPTQLLTSPLDFEDSQSGSPSHNNFHEAETQIIDPQELEPLEEVVPNVADSNPCNVSEEGEPALITVEGPNEDLNSDRETPELPERSDSVEVTDAELVSACDSLDVREKRDTVKTPDNDKRNESCLPDTKDTTVNDNLQISAYCEDSNISDDFLDLHNKVREDGNETTVNVSTNEIVSSNEEQDKNEDPNHQTVASTLTASSKTVNDEVESDCETDVEETLLIPHNRSPDISGIISGSESDEALNDTDVIPATQEVLSEVFAYRKEPAPVNNTTQLSEDSFKLGLTQLMTDKIEDNVQDHSNRKKSSDADIYSMPTQRWNKEENIQNVSVGDECNSSLDRIYMLPTQKICDFDKEVFVHPGTSRACNEEVDSIYFQPTQKLNLGEDNLSLRAKKDVHPEATEEQASIYLMETQKLDIVVGPAAKTNISNNSTEVSKKSSDLVSKTSEEMNISMENDVQQDNLLPELETEKTQLQEEPSIQTPPIVVEIDKDSARHNLPEKVDNVDAASVHSSDSTDIEEDIYMSRISPKEPEDERKNSPGVDISRTEDKDKGENTPTQPFQGFLVEKSDNVEHEVDKADTDNRSDQAKSKTTRNRRRKSPTNITTPVETILEKETPVSTRTKRRCQSMYRTGEKSEEPTPKVAKAVIEDTPVTEKKSSRVSKRKNTKTASSNIEDIKSKIDTKSPLLKLDVEMNVEESDSEYAINKDIEQIMSITKFESPTVQNKKKSFYDLNEYDQEFLNDHLPKKMLKLSGNNKPQKASVPGLKLLNSPKLIAEKHSTKEDIKLVAEELEQSSKPNLPEIESGLSREIADVEPTPKEDSKVTVKRSKRTSRASAPNSKSAPPQQSNNENESIKEESMPSTKRSRRTLKPNLSESKPDVPQEGNDDKDTVKEDTKHAVRKTRRAMKSEDSEDDRHSAKEDTKPALNKAKRTLRSKVPDIKPDNRLQSGDNDEQSTKEDTEPIIKKSRRTLKLESIQESDDKKHGTEDPKTPAKKSKRNLKPKIPDKKSENVPKADEIDSTKEEDSEPIVKKSRRSVKLQNTPESGDEKQPSKEDTKPVTKKARRTTKASALNVGQEKLPECNDDEHSTKEDIKPVAQRSRRTTKSNVPNIKLDKPATSSDSSREDIGLSVERTKRTLKPKVVFTLMNDPSLESAIRQLGGSVVDTTEAATILVTESVKRTQKLLSAIGHSKPICSPQWIRESKKASKFLDPWDFILVDSEAEAKWNFSLSESLRRSSESKLLNGFTFHIVMNNAVDVLKSAIETCGGKCINKITRKDSTDKLYIVSAPELGSKYSKLLKQHGVTAVAAEAIFDGVLRQEMKFENHILS